MREIKHRWQVIGYIQETNEYYYITSFNKKWKAKWYVHWKSYLHKGNIQDKGNQ